MPRSRTPTSILEAKGTYLSHPETRRLNEPTHDRPLGPPPTSLSKAEKKVWKQLVSEACPGVLMASDRLMFCLLVRLATKFYAKEPMMMAETSQMITLSGKFALNSADRSKVSVEKPKSSTLTTFLARSSKTA